MCKFYYRIIWSNSFIAIAIDKNLKNNFKIPITSFYFWPNVNGWVLLKRELNLKPWLLEEEKIKILNGYTKIILDWKNSFMDKENNNFVKLEENKNFILIGIE